MARLTAIDAVHAVACRINKRRVIGEVSESFGDHESESDDSGETATSEWRDLCAGVCWVSHGCSYSVDSGTPPRSCGKTDAHFSPSAPSMPALCNTGVSQLQS